MVRLYPLNGVLLDAGGRLEKERLIRRHLVKDNAGDGGLAAPAHG